MIDRGETYLGLRVVFLSGASIYLILLAGSMFVLRFDFLMQTVEPYLVLGLGLWCAWEAWTALSVLVKQANRP